MSLTAFDHADLVQEARALEFPNPRPRREAEPASFNLSHVITSIRRFAWQWALKGNGE